MTIASRFLVIGMLVSAVLALPATIPVLDGIPPNAATVATDHELNVVIAYDVDGTVLGQLPTSSLRARDTTGPCAQMSSQDLQRLPGWEKIAQYARDKWGGGWDTVNANPDKYPTYGAMVCVSGQSVVKLDDADQSCTTQNQRSKGTMTNAAGEATLDAKQGSSQSTQFTVTTESSIAVGTSFSASFEIPEVADLTAEISSTVTFTNTLASSNTYEVNGETSQGIKVVNEFNKTCSLAFDVTSCSFTGTGRVRMLASGWAWFFYGSRRNGHYHWRAPIDKILSVQERETFINFRSSSSTRTNSEYNVECHPTDE